MAKVIKKTKATTKPVAKKTVAKPAPKKAAAKTKTVAKAAPKKTAIKATPKKAVTKVAPKKAAVKSTPKKATVVAKKAAVKVTSKPAPKKAAVKVAPKKTAVKPVAKKATTKVPAKKTAAKPIKIATAKITTKEVAVKAKVTKPVVVKTKEVAKPIVKETSKNPIAKTAIKEVKNPTKTETKKAALAKPAPANKKAESIIPKTAAEKAHDHNLQRHIHDAKPAMETSVVRYSDADLAIFKEVILKKIAKAKEEIDFYSDQIKNTSESQTEFASIDDGSSTSERENMNQIVVRMQKLISHLESALVRIENKSYGICRETGKLIPKERLMVVPHATLSVEGKKLEKK